jgi:hypothetical protein
MGFDVHVVNEEGDAIEGARVVLSFTSVLRGVSTEEYTDSDGHADFDGYDDGEVQVFVNGSSYGTYHYEDGGGITITE